MEEEWPLVVKAKKKGGTQGASFQFFSLIADILAARRNQELIKGE